MSFTTTIILILCIMYFHNLYYTHFALVCMASISAIVYNNGIFLLMMVMGVMVCYVIWLLYCNQNMWSYNKINIIVKYLLPYLTYFTDVDECNNDTSGCEQLCNNTIGSYYCTCSEGYYLGNDNHSCLGM